LDGNYEMENTNQIKKFFLSFEGIILISFFLLSIIIRLFNFSDVSFFLTLFGLLISIIILIKEKLSSQKIVLEKLNNFSSFIDNILEDEFMFSDIPEIKKTEIKTDFLNIYEKKLSNLSYDFIDLFDGLIEKILHLKNLKEESEKDFIKYYFYRIYSEKDLLKMSTKYSGLNNINMKNKFLDLIYNYFLTENKSKNLDQFFSSIKDTTLEEKNRALFFIKGSLDEVNSILEKINNLEDSDEKRIYLEKLNEELREHLSERGISLEKYHEAAFSKSENAFLIFHQKLGTQINKKFLEQNIKHIPLLFTGPFVIISEKSKTTSDLKKELGLNPKKSESHNLIILKINPADTFISSGLDIKAKKTSKRSLEKVSKSISKFGKVSDIAKINSLVLDKPLKEFVESFGLDFLIKDKLSTDLKTKLRTETKRVLNKLIKEGFNIKGITDLYNIPEDKIEKIIIDIGINKKKSNEFAKQIKNSANSWRYILYGYKEGDKK
jgi:hypothetical protein